MVGSRGSQPGGAGGPFCRGRASPPATKPVQLVSRIRSGGSAGGRSPLEVVWVFVIDSVVLGGWADVDGDAPLGRWLFRQPADAVKRKTQTLATAATRAALLGCRGAPATVSSRAAHVDGHFNVRLGRTGRIGQMGLRSRNFDALAVIHDANSLRGADFDVADGRRLDGRVGNRDLRLRRC